MAKKGIIDPGHGGIDPGGEGFGVKEKDWTLEISLYQYKRLKELGADISITRTTDKTLDDDARTALIKDKYDYCFSNHFNAFNGEARGVETIHSIFATDYVAELVANAIVMASGLPLRRVFSRKYGSLDYYYMHRMTGTTQTIIIEYGFIDNKLDHDYYKNKRNFYEVAERVIKVWCALLGVKYVAKESDKPKSEGRYIQTGGLNGDMIKEVSDYFKNKNWYAEITIPNNGGSPYATTGGLTESMKDDFEEWLNGKGWAYSIVDSM